MKKDKTVATGDFVATDESAKKQKEVTEYLEKEAIKAEKRLLKK